MAEAAVARETLFALRETIARLEGRPIPALAAAAHETLADKPARQMAGIAKSLPIQPTREQSFLPIGVDELDAALQGGLPLDALTEIRSLGLRDAGVASGLPWRLPRGCMRKLWTRSRPSLRFCGSAIRSRRWRLARPMPSASAISGWSLRLFCRRRPASWRMRSGSRRRRLAVLPLPSSFWKYAAIPPVSA